MAQLFFLRAQKLPRAKQPAQPFRFFTSSKLIGKRSKRWAARLHRPCVVHEYMQGHPLIKIGPTAKSLKLSVPTITGALESLAKLKIAKEMTGKRRDRLFAYPRYLHILSEGTEPLRNH